MNEQATWFVVAGALALRPCVASEVLPKAFYEIAVETSMPHLDEALRYSSTREQRCLSDQDFRTAFPALSHPALKGCALKSATRHEGELSYDLHCEGKSETTGHARWRVGDRMSVGTLHVRLGGKNMTFSQRMTLTRLRACGS